MVAQASTERKPRWGAWDWDTTESLQADELLQVIRDLSHRQLVNLHHLDFLNFRTYSDSRRTANLRDDLETWCRQMDSYRDGLGLEKLREALAKMEAAEVCGACRRPRMRIENRTRHDGERRRCCEDCAQKFYREATR